MEANSRSCHETDQLGADVIIAALRRNRGLPSAIANELGVPQEELERRISELGIVWSVLEGWHAIPVKKAEVSAAEKTALSILGAELRERHPDDRRLGDADLVARHKVGDILAQLAASIADHNEVMRRAACSLLGPV